MTVKRMRGIIKAELNSMYFGIAFVHMPVGNTASADTSP